MEELLLRQGVGVLHGSVNAGFIYGSDGAVVIDTMYSPADGREIESFLRRQTTVPVLAVVNTHHHADHTFGNQVFGAPVVASEDCRRRMVENLATAWSEAELANLRRTLGERINGLRITLPSVTFGSGLALHVGAIGGSGGGDGRLDVHLAGGHTPGSSTVFLPHEGIMFSGDLYFVGRYPFMRHAHTTAWVAALEVIKALRPTLLVPGHGPVCDAEAAIREADRMIGYFLETRGKLEAMLAQGLGREEILARAPEFPRAAPDGYERSHAANVGCMLDELQAGRRPA